MLSEQPEKMVLQIEADFEPIPELLDSINDLQSELDNDLICTEQKSSFPKQLEINKKGYDLLRLKHPSLEDVNDDFLCAICSQLVNTPLECSNPTCSALYFTYCLNLENNKKNEIQKCEVCESIEN